MYLFKISIPEYILPTPSGALCDLTDSHNVIHLLSFGIKPSDMG